MEFADDLPSWNMAIEAIDMAIAHIAQK